MTRTMVDGLNPSAIPLKLPDVLLAYMDLADANVDSMRARFPKKPIMTITRVGGKAKAHAIDIEPGCVWPIPEGVKWLKDQIEAGEDVHIGYISESNWPELKAEVERAGITAQMGDQYLVAAYPGPGAVLIPGSIGHQWAGDPGNSPGDYDISIIVDFIPGFDKPRDLPFLPNTRKVITTAEHAVIKVTALLDKRLKSGPGLTPPGKTRLRNLDTALQACSKAINKLLALP